MATTVSTAVLKAVPLFSSFPEDQLRMLTTVVARKSVPRSTTVMAGGDPTDSLYIVLSGRLKVMMSDADGKEVILSILGPGEFFGEMGVLEKARRNATVVAKTPMTLLTLSGWDVKRLESKSPEAMRELENVIEQRRKSS